MGIRVLIVDDHEVVRSGLRSLFADTEIEIAGEASDGKEAVATAAEIKPDLVLMDIRMPNADGLSALEQIHRATPDLPIVVLSTYDNPTYIARALTLGATDYLLKGSDSMDLVAAIRNAHHGDTSSRSDQAKRVSSAMDSASKDPAVELPLTSRETQVLKHIALGLSNKEIGRSLSISIETVKEHVQNILRKIKAIDRTQAAVWAVRKRLV